MVRVRVPRRDDRDPNYNADIDDQGGYGMMGNSTLSPDISRAAPFGNNDSVASSSQRSHPSNTARSAGSGIGALKAKVSKVSKSLVKPRSCTPITASLLESGQSSVRSGSHKPLAPSEYSQLSRVTSEGITKDNSEMYRERFHNRLKEVMLKPNPLVLKRQEALKRKRDEILRQQKMNSRQSSVSSRKPLNADDFLKDRGPLVADAVAESTSTRTCLSPPTTTMTPHTDSTEMTDSGRVLDTSCSYYSDKSGQNEATLSGRRYRSDQSPTYHLTSPLAVNHPKSRVEAYVSEKTVVPPRAKTKRGAYRTISSSSDGFSKRYDESDHPRYRRYYADPLQSVSSNDTFQSEYTEDFESSTEYTNDSCGTGMNLRNSYPSSQGASQEDVLKSSTRDTGFTDDSPEIYIVKQQFGIFSFLIGVTQIVVLTTMIIQCGMAPVYRPAVNPMLGPYPDVLSYWGASNAYLIIHGREWWRIFSPILLNTGIIHIIVSVGIQMDQGALFEKEWGSLHWIIIYLVSGASGSILSCVFMPDTISVGSSGAVCGLFGAKLSEVLCRACEEKDTKQKQISHKIRSGQFQETGCCILILSLFSFIPYVDWAYHLGGFLGGLFIGFAMFSPRCFYFVCAILFSITGWGMTVFMFAFGITYMYAEVQPSSNLGSYCQYFVETSGLSDYDCVCDSSTFLENYSWSSLFKYDNSGGYDDAQSSNYTVAGNYTDYNY